MISDHDKYPLIDEWKWKSFQSPSKPKDIDQFIIDNLTKKRDFHIGSDSKDYGKNTVYATALIAHHCHGGGAVIIHKDKAILCPSLRQKLIMEAMRTLEVAWYLNQRIPATTKIRLHIDVNNNIKFQSGQYKEELVGFIMGQGYISYRDVNAENEPRVVLWKPDSWAASSVADKRT